MQMPEPPKEGEEAKPAGEEPKEGEGTTPATPGETPEKPVEPQ